MILIDLRSLIHPREGVPTMVRSPVRPTATVALAITLTALAAAPAGAQQIDPSFSGYTLGNPLSVPGVPLLYGGLTFQAGQPNTLLIGGHADNSGGAIYSAGVTRDTAGRVT